MITIVMDTCGRVVSFLAIPSAALDDGDGSATDWASLFAAAELDMTTFVAATPVWTPAVFADELRAWTGTYADHSDLPLRIEAASAGGRVVRFQVIGPWETATSRMAASVQTGDVAARALLAVVMGGVQIGGEGMEQHHLRVVRGESSGGHTVAHAEGHAY